MMHFSVGLNEKGQDGLSRDTAKEVLREMGTLLSVPSTAFAISGVRKDGVYYAIFSTRAARAFFLGALGAVGVPTKSIDGLPSGVKVSPTFQPAMPSAPTLEGLMDSVVAFDTIGKLLRERKG